MPKNLDGYLSLTIKKSRLSEEQRTHNIREDLNEHIGEMVFSKRLIFMPANYDLNKIKFATDETTFKRAVGLYESGKVTETEEAFGDFTAVVLGTKPYRVSVSGRNYKNGHCTCYVGEKGTLCKHMVALALYAVMGGKPLGDKDKELSHGVECSGRRGVLNKEEIEVLKKSITESMRYIKPYRGPSRTWFANQDSLREGCNRLSVVISDLSVSRQSADILVKLLLRLEKKLSVGGVDDSNGIVGGLAGELVALLEEFAKIDPSCIDAFESLCGKKYCFGWEDSLVRIFDERIR
ncbi:MAG: SWIM zinc finger family protein [Candidatus Omnitrophota bacterium]